MFRHSNSLIVLFLINLFFPQFVYSQDIQYKFDRLTTEDGLSAMAATDVIKGSDGFIWIGTSRGLNRYDGYDVKVFRDFPVDTGFVQLKLINGLYEDKKGNLWVLTNRNGLALFDRNLEKFIPVSHRADGSKPDISSSIMNMYEDKDSVLWVGAAHTGLAKYNQESMRFDVYMPNPIEKDNSNNILSMYEDKSGIFWVGTGNGLYHFNKNTRSFTQIIPKPAPPRKYNVFCSIMEDKMGLLWIGTDWGLYQYNPSNKRWKHFSPNNETRMNGPSHSIILGFIEYYSKKEHYMWICSGWGLNKYDYKTETFQHYFHDSKNQNSLLNNRIRNFYLDDQDILWVVANGISKLDLNQHRFQHIGMKNYPDGLLCISGSCFCEDYKRNLWVGTAKDGIYQYDVGMNLISYFKPQDKFIAEKRNATGDIIYLMYEDSYNRLWIFANNLFIRIFKNNSKFFIKVPIDVPESSSDPKAILDVLEDYQGNIWFGTGYGLYHKHVSTKINLPIHLYEHPELSKSYVLDLFEDADSTLWIVTLNGIYRLLTQDRYRMNFKKFERSEYEPANLRNRHVRDMYQDIFGTIWFRSERDLYQYDVENDKITLFPPFGNLFPKDNYDFTGDYIGNLWFICEAGLLRYNPYDTSSNSIRIFNRNEGLPFDEINHISLYRGGNNYLYVGSFPGSGNGFFRFIPEDITYENKKIPPVVLADFKVRNEYFSLDSSITVKKAIILKHHQNFFSFKFAALDFVCPDKNQYAYKLEGFDENWIYCENRRLANYTGVPPGEYIFKVKGSNNDGVWNEEGTSLSISILPPPWRTWWAYTLYGIALGSLLFALRWYDLKRQRLKQNLELERVEKDKLGELDKMKSRFFANISHEFRTPLTLILGPLGDLEKEAPTEKCKKDLNLIQRNALRLHQLINQLLSLSKLESGQMKLHAEELNIVQLVKGYTQSFESLARQKEIKLKFESQKDEIMLWVDQDKVEKILYNLLSNAFKYTGSGGSITVEVARHKHPDARHQTPEAKNTRLATGDLELVSENSVCIKVSDTGSGIDEARLPHIFDRFYQADDTYKADSEGTGIGLALTKELVELHHGQIIVGSEKGVGSRFDVYLPLGESHIKPKEKTEKRELKSESEISELLPTVNCQLSTDSQQLATDNRQPTTDSDKPILLIVEDNFDLRIYIRGHLEQECNIIEAQDGQQGLEQAIEHVPDLVLSDVMMPEMDGFELCNKLKTDERTSHIPVVLLTARASSESKIEGLETGADDFITKPFDVQELKIRIHNLIRQRIELRKKYQQELGLDLKDQEEHKLTLDQIFIHKAREVAISHIGDPEFTANQFSQEMALSRVQLHRKLKAIVDQTASEFVRNIRLNYAAKLIKAKKGNIAQIAFEAGFNNLSYFSKCFHEKFGVNPSQYGK